MTDETVVYFGDSIKALGNGRVGGYLVRFGDATKTDLEGEYFAPDTYFGRVQELDIYYQHGLDPVLKRRVLGGGTLKKDDVGLWLEAQLELRDEYEKAIYGMIEQGKQGWSSGSASHLVERSPDGKAKRITRWPIAEASVTPTPAEPRNSALPLKSLINSTDDDVNMEPETPTEAAIDGVGSGNVQAESHDAEVIKSNANMEVIVMSDDKKTQEQAPAPEQAENNALQNELKSKLEKNEEQLSALMNAFTKFLEAEPRVNRAGYFTVDGGTADASIKNAADMLMAVKRGDHKRLVQHYGLKAQTEGSGPAGGYYVPEQVLQDMLPSLNLQSGVGQLVTRIPVQSPAGRMPIRDYSRVPTAGAGNTATAQGVESQSRSEGGAYAAETAYFEMLQYVVTDAASGYVRASRELSEDYPAIEAALRNAIQQDVASKEEYFILRGSGVNQPLGVMNWSGTIDLDEDTDNTFVVADADEMLSRLLVANAGRVAWVHHHSIITSIAGFERGTGGSVYQPNISGALPESLHGYMRFNSQHLPQIGTDGYVILGDWSQYFIFERGGLYIEFSEHADFTNGNNTWRFGKRLDGKPALTAAVTLGGPGSAFTLSPFVAIANKT